MGHGAEVWGQGLQAHGPDVERASAAGEVPGAGDAGLVAGLTQCIDLIAMGRYLALQCGNGLCRLFRLLTTFGEFAFQVKFGKRARGASTTARVTPGRIVRSAGTTAPSTE